MADRRRQIVQLLGSRFDGLYLPPGALNSRAGFVPSSLELCPVCDGTREVRDRFGRSRPCSRCDGRGRLAFDPMDSLHVPVGSESTSSSARPRRTVTCDRCDRGVLRGAACPSCGGTGRRDLHAFELHLDTRDVDEQDPMLEAIERRDRAGSYRELEQALADMRHAGGEPRFAPLAEYVTEALRLLDAVFVPPAVCAEADLNPAEHWLVELALAYLASRMPQPIRVPVDVRANAKLLAERRTRARGRSSDPAARAQRDREIVRHDHHGRPAQWIAAEYGLSVATVYEIVNGARA